LTPLFEKIGVWPYEATPSFLKVIPKGIMAYEEENKKRKFKRFKNIQFSKFPVFFLKFLCRSIP